MPIIWMPRCRRRAGAGRPGPAAAELAARRLGDCGLCAGAGGRPRRPARRTVPRQNAAAGLERAGRAAGVSPPPTRGCFWRRCRPAPGEEPWIYTRGIGLAEEFLGMTAGELLPLVRRAAAALERDTVQTKEALDQYLADRVRPLLPAQKRPLWDAPSMYGSPGRQTVGGAVASFLLRPCAFGGQVVFGFPAGGAPHLHRAGALAGAAAAPGRPGRRRAGAGASVLHLLRPGHAAGADRLAGLQPGPGQPPVGRRRPRHGGGNAGGPHPPDAGPPTWTPCPTCPARSRRRFCCLAPRPLPGPAGPHPCFCRTSGCSGWCGARWATPARFCSRAGWPAAGKARPAGAACWWRRFSGRSRTPAARAAVQAKAEAWAAFRQMPLAECQFSVPGVTRPDTQAKPPAPPNRGAGPCFVAAGQAASIAVRLGFGRQAAGPFAPAPGRPGPGRPGRGSGCPGGPPARGIWRPPPVERRIPGHRRCNAGPAPACAASAPSCPCGRSRYRPETATEISAHSASFSLVSASSSRRHRSRRPIALFTAASNPTGLCLLSPIVVPAGLRSPCPALGGGCLSIHVPADRTHYFSTKWRNSEGRLRCVLPNLSICSFAHGCTQSRVLQ